MSKLLASLAVAATTLFFVQAADAATPQLHTSTHATHTLTASKRGFEYGRQGSTRSFDHEGRIGSTKGFEYGGLHTFHSGHVLTFRRHRHGHTPYSGLPTGKRMH